MEFENKLNIITNILVIITVIFTIILIIDELYNIGLFTFKYTYLYNYGSFHSKFNNIQTIESETNRFNVYNNSNFLYKDIFNKSYFNYLIKISITLITILFVITYGLYFYETFIISQKDDICSFDKYTSLPKRILKCICNDCHKYIPDCSDNYIVAFILIIIIPLSYLFKSFLTLDFTPNSNSTVFTLIYVIIFILLIFKYSYNIFNLKKKDFKELIVYVIATILLIVSGYIYKYIYNKYNNNITLLSKTNNTVFNDIYRQSPPIKPEPIKKPAILDTFKYDPKSIDPKYKLEKEIVDNYYKAIKNYDNELNYYTQRYNNYVNSLNSNLSDKINFTNVFLNISGLNNYLHIWLIVLIIIIAIIYYNYTDNNLLFACLIYLISILTILTIMNSIQYYNTYVNKYIIYEPSSQYKNDIANANTKLNLILDPSNGENFYNILTNNKNVNGTNSALDNDYTNSETTINNDIKSLTYDNNIINSNIISKIHSNIINLPNVNNDSIKGDYSVYYNITDSGTPINTFYTNAVSFVRNNISKFPIENLYFHYKNNIKVDITSNYHKYSNLKIYYQSYQLYKLIDKLEKLLYKGIKKIKDKYYTFLYDIHLNYKTIYGTSSVDNNFTLIDNNITSIIAVTIEPDKIDNEVFNKFKTDILNKIVISSTNTIRTFNTTITDSSNIYIASDYISIARTDNPFNSLSAISITKNPNNFIPEKISSTFEELPIKITDIFNNEYYTGGADTFKFNSIKIKTTQDDLTNKLLVIPKYKSIVSITTNITEFKTGDNIYTINNNNNVVYPFNISQYDDTDTDTINLIKIVMRILVNNLICINEFQDTDTTLKNFLINKDTGELKNLYFNTLFNVINIETIQLTSIYDQPNIKFFKSWYSYLIFLYNIYTYDQNILLDKIEYSIYNYSSNIDNYTNENLYKNLQTLKTKITKSNKSNLIDKYIKNIYIIKFVVKLYSLFIEKIKYKIETEIDKTLCTVSNTISAIETKLYIHMNANFEFSTKFIPLSMTEYVNAKNTATSATATEQNKKAALDSLTPVIPTITKKQNKYKDDSILNEYGIILNSLFNIILYLLRYNITKDGDKSIKAITDTIISNYTFYNSEETDIDLEYLRSELKINCNYYNKYNTLNNKQIANIKNNANVVAYNFPVLAVIFLIFLGESIFIKS